MIEIVLEFIAKKDTRGQFELAYGPGGAWSKLFSRCPGFRGTTLMRDTKNPQRYLTIDLWDTVDQREQALAEHKTEYAELKALFGEWTESVTEVGTFSVRGEATVRPRVKASRSRTGETRQSQYRKTR